MGGIVTKEIEQGRVFMKKILFVVLTFAVDDEDRIRLVDETRRMSSFCIAGYGKYSIPNI